MTTGQQIKTLLERTQLSDLLVRYFRSIDDKQFDLQILNATFTSDARIIRPNGTETTGHDQMLKTNRKSFARFKATHHVTGDYVIDIEDNTAIIQANLTGMHLWADDENNPTLNNKQFYAGSVLTAKAIRTNNKWRIRELTYRNIWRTGDGLSEMARFARP